jgi:hypothetical protein
LQGKYLKTAIMNRACFTEYANLHEQNQHASSPASAGQAIRPIKNKFVRIKTKLFLLLVMSILIFNISFSQDLLSYTTEGLVTEKDSSANRKKSPSFEFKAYPKDSYLNSISKEMAGEHPLGELIAKKIYLFNEFYTSEENLFPGNPATKTIIKKPVIYESVKRIERDLKKSVKKGETSVSYASSILNTVLDVALNIQTEDTRDFEKAIGNAGSTRSKIDLFTKMVRLNY